MRLHRKCPGEMQNATILAMLGSGKGKITLYKGKRGSSSESVPSEPSGLDDDSRSSRLVNVE